MMNATPLPGFVPANADPLRLHLPNWALPALWLLVALVYWPGLGGGYVFDDFSNIVDNAALHVSGDSTWRQWLEAVFSSPSDQLQRPLAMLSFAINHALTGLDPYWMKLTNLGIHLLNTTLVFVLIQQVIRASARIDANASRNPWIALWVAAAWALNPINLMAVLFTVQRMESLCHTFVFAGLWLYLLGRERLLTEGRGWPTLLAGLLGGTALGALVKESAVLLPLYALALEWTVLHFASVRQVPNRGLIWTFAATLLLPGIVSLAWLLPKVLQAGAYSNRNFSLGERLLSEARVVVDYLHWTLLPDLGQLSLYHDDFPVSHGLLSPPGTLLAVMLLAGLLVAMAWLRKRRPLMALGLAWFLAAQLLTATVIPLELMFEHRNYFASLGVCLVLADACLGAPRTRSQQRLGLLASVALLLMYAGFTALRANEWHDQMRFSMSERTKHPGSPRATYDVARNFVILSGYRPDSPYLPRAFAALDFAMDVPNATPLPESTAITLAARTATPIQPTWWSGFQHKLRVHPIGPQEIGALNALVTCQLQQNCPLPSQDMVRTFDAALARGSNPDILGIYGNYALNVLHDPDLALRLWQDAARLAPNVVQNQVTLAQMLIASGRPEEAAVHIAQVRRLGRLGQNEGQARELERLAAAKSNEPPLPDVTGTKPRGQDPK